eukprot:962206-Prorocentrum_minimum.AAC.3
MVAIPRLYPHGEVTTSQGGSAEATEALPNGQSKTYGTMWVKNSELSQFPNLANSSVKPNSQRRPDVRQTSRPQATAAPQVRRRRACGPQFRDVARPRSDARPAGFQ